MQTLVQAMKLLFARWLMVLNVCSIICMGLLIVPGHLEIPQVQDKVSLELAALLRLQSMVGSLARKTRELLQELTPTAS